MVTIKVSKIHPSAKVPQYMSEGASGCDVCACLTAPMTIASHARAAVPTGLKVEIPRGYEIQVRPRSGFAFKKGLTVVNAPGTIDSDYRGEIQVLLVNLSDAPVTVEPGDRIAQFVVQQVETCQWQETATLSETARNEGGFGSTGFKA